MTPPTPYPPKLPPQSDSTSPRDTATTTFPVLTPDPSASTSSSGHATPSSSSDQRGDAGPSSNNAARSQFSTILADFSGASRREDEVDIEMEPMGPAGHRRRRSSLMNPSNGLQNSRASRQRGQSLSANCQDEPKILEESPDGPEDDSLSDEDLHDDEEAGLTGKDRRRKQKKRRRNRLMDNRIAREHLSAEEKSAADKNVVRRLVVNGSLIMLWYLFSLCISLVSIPPIAPTPTPLRNSGLTGYTCSITSGCSMATSSTSRSLCSPPRYTC